MREERGPFLVRRLFESSEVDLVDGLFALLHFFSWRIFLWTVASFSIDLPLVTSRFLNSLRRPPSRYRERLLHKPNGGRPLHARFRALRRLPDVTGPRSTSV